MQGVVHVLHRCHHKITFAALRHALLESKVSSRSGPTKHVLDFFIYALAILAVLRNEYICSALRDAVDSWSFVSME